MSVLERETVTHPFETCSFLWGDHNYLLRQPVRVFSAYQDGLWVFECPAYGLSTFSADRQEALQQLNEEFGFIYEGLIHEPDASLTRDAIILREKLREDVKQVQTIV